MATMATQQEQIDSLKKHLRQTQAELHVLRQLVLAIYSHGTDFNGSMLHFVKLTEELKTHNTFSKLPEDYVSTYAQQVNQLAQEMENHRNRVPEINFSREKLPSDRDDQNQ